MKYNSRFYVLLINTYNSRKPWQHFAWLKTPLYLSLKENIKIKIQDVLLQLIIIIMLWNRNFLVPYPVCNGITGTKFCMGCATITFFSSVTALPQKKKHKVNIFTILNSTFVHSNNNNSTYCYEWSTQRYQIYSDSLRTFK